MTALLCFLLIVFICVGISGVIYPFFPITEKYIICSDKLQKDRKILLLTDLHGCHFGKKNKKLIRKITELAPDIICISGDMTVKSGKNTEDMLELMDELVRICPVYYAPGNHEIRMPEYDSYKQRLEKAGVVYLENASQKIGEDIRIYGLDLPEYWYHKFWEKRKMSAEELVRCMGECEHGVFSILLAHNPEYFPDYAEWGADLTLSGHIHGGIARLPFAGGVIAPSLALFPRYDAGCFARNRQHMIVSRGLGLHHIKLRYFNRPEISLINLSCQDGEK